LAQNVARLLQRFDVRRITAASTTASGLWGDEILSFDGFGSDNQRGAYVNTESINLSPASDPSDDGGAVVLTQSGGVYASSGTYVTPFMDFKSAPTAFDRLRYGYDPAKGSVRYRIASFANLTDARTFSGSPVEETQPRGVGVDLSGLVARRYVAVEFTLSTSDTHVTPALEFVEVTARRALPGILVPTSVPSVPMGWLDVGGRSLYVVLEQVCDRFGLEYRLAADGTVEFQEEPAPGALGSVWGVDRRNTATFVEGVHGNIRRLVQDDVELANAVLALGLGEGGNRLLCVVEDAASQAAYGLRQVVWEGSEMSLSDLKARADALLARRKEPTMRLEFDVVATPNGRAEFAPGDLVRVVSRHRRGVDGNPLDLSLRLLRETREETPSGERIRLECGMKARPLTEGLLRWGWR